METIQINIEKRLKMYGKISRQIDKRKKQTERLNIRQKDGKKEESQEKDREK